jgi:hypothetical protein
LPFLRRPTFLLLGQPYSLGLSLLFLGEPLHLGMAM